MLVSDEGQSLSHRDYFLCKKRVGWQTLPLRSGGRINAIKEINVHPPHLKQLLSFTSVLLMPRKVCLEIFDLR